MHWPIEAIRSALERRCGKDGKDPVQVVHAFLGPGAAPDAFRTGVKTNLQAGQIRRLFVGDAVPPELRRIVGILGWAVHQVKAATAGR